MPVCPDCYGKLQRERNSKFPPERKVTMSCPHCDGTGKINGWECVSCKGKGTYKTTEGGPPLGYGFGPYGLGNVIVGTPDHGQGAP